MEKTKDQHSSTEITDVDPSNSSNMNGSSSTREVFSFADNPRTKLFLTIGLISSVFNGLMYPAMSWAFAETFSAFNSEDMMKDVEKIALILVLIGLLAFLFGFLQVTLLELAATGMTISFKTQWFKALLRQDIAYFDAENISGTASTISSHGNKFRRGIGMKLGQGIQFTVSIIGCIAYAFWVSWKTSIVLLALVPLMSLSTYFLIKLTTEQSKDTADSFIDAASVTYKTVSNIRTVLSLCMVKRMISEFCHGTSKAYDNAVKRVGLIGFANGAVMGSFLLCYVVITLFGSFLIYDCVRETGCDPSGADTDNVCAESGSDVFGALMGISIAGSGIAQIGVTFEAKKVIDRDIGSVHEVNSQDDSKSYKLPVYEIDSSSDEGIKETLTGGKISFNNVSFRYPTRQDKIVLSNFSLDIQSGSTIAIVGTSGCGKSSIMNLLMRFYDPTNGDIYIDGFKLKDFNVNCIRNQIGIVQQEPILFATTIAENISYGNRDATQFEIEEAARKANAHDFITAFSKGYDTEVGEKGAQLSGGQKQRIAIARAILKHPKILLLDEATSALDSESEKIVQNALDTLLTKSHGIMTTIIVAHRLSTVRNADAIAFMSDGSITEYGTHETLMKISDGNYKHLVERQSGTSSDTAVLEEEPFDFCDEFDYDETSLPHLKFDRVTFAYPTRAEENVLEGFNLSVRKNETLALVGGCGKSSCLSLIERFYDPISGKIELDGNNIKSYNVSDLREKIGFVQQEPVLFDGTIAENISMGFKKASVEQIEQAAKNANAHDFIVSFPLGYQTRVGEGGSQISGGQKQRIAIARTILRNPEILLLDEATSALDSESEKIVQSTLDELMKRSEQTTIVIAHRLSTVRNSDRIAVLFGGRVREIGNHDQLMRRHGIYRRLVELQESNVDLDLDHLISDEEFGLRRSSLSASQINQERDEAEECEPDIKTVRKMSEGDVVYLIIGAIGAMFTGAIFPLWGIVFGEMINLLYKPVDCDPSLEDCSSEYDSVADDMEHDSFVVGGWWTLLILQTFVGYSLMFYGFGVASERLNKRIRDAAFISLIRQEVGFFDTLNASSLTSQLQNDVNLLQAFTSQPVRVLVMNLCSVLVGVIISFIYMWPMALMALLTLPLYSVGAIGEAKLFMGEDEKVSSSHLAANSPGGIIVESLVSIRTVASLTLEDHIFKKYCKVLRNEDQSIVKSSMLLGAIAGFSLCIQFVSFGFYFWWGGYLIDNFHYDYNNFLISLFALIFSMSGMAVAMMDLASKEEAATAAERLFKIINRRSKIDPLEGFTNKIDPIEGFTSVTDKTQLSSMDSPTNTLEIPLLSTDN